MGNFIPAILGILSSALTAVDKNGNFVTPIWDYTMALEYWTGDYWQAKKLLTGYFKYQTPKKVFYLAGLPQGRYRVRMYYQMRQNPDNTGQIITYSFQVDR
ncbi:hypothetical protein [Caenibacillus caldisaponilyticus]|uniref:hypothetical protein n=1 Tax=Caenibacillus caldisaponilyticus TaxID=1674942 RepID=UPI0011785F81|nr:hypothetical protein [Caenibacillus caldisaponilyticus]